MLATDWCTTTPHDARAVACNSATVLEWIDKCSICRITGLDSHSRLLGQMSRRACDPCAAHNTDRAKPRVDRGLNLRSTDNSPLYDTLSRHFHGWRCTRRHCTREEVHLEVTRAV